LLGLLGVLHSSILSTSSNTFNRSNLLMPLSD
jgi:hypothetical protein